MQFKVVGQEGLVPSPRVSVMLLSLHGDCCAVSSERVGGAAIQGPSPHATSLAGTGMHLEQSFAQAHSVGQPRNCSLSTPDQSPAHSSDAHLVPGSGMTMPAWGAAVS